MWEGRGGVERELGFDGQHLRGGEAMGVCIIMLEKRKHCGSGKKGVLAFVMAERAIWYQNDGCQNAKRDNAAEK